MASHRTIVWFRRDLRLEDNPALASAARDGSVLLVYIWCPAEEGNFYPGRVSRWWLKQSLLHFNHSLKSLGAELLFIKTDSTLATLLECVKAVAATKVVFNQLYDPVSLVRDHNVKENLAKHGIAVETFNGDLLFEPWDIYDDNGIAFTRFDPYWKKCMQMQIDPVFHLPPWRLVPIKGNIDSSSLEELGLENDADKSSNVLLGRGWAPGWSNADKTLTDFTEHHLIDYANTRMKAGTCSTSLLSPYLHYGELSVRKVFEHGLKKLVLWRNDGNAAGVDSATLFLRSIGLREYSRYVCFNFPYTYERSLMTHLKYFPWDISEANFKAWRQGRTGYPLVDAGMRELWATGWIHNRIRVIVSSFCVKVLLIPWTWGMKYFWDTLLDADLECDILGWQYISGSLPDGHDLERLDCPELQGSKYDPNGEYVRQWLPELARMPTEWIHHPWDAPVTTLKASGVELGQNYPTPIVHIDDARERLNKAIFKMWELDAAALSSNLSDSGEVVDESGDSSYCNSIPKVVIKGKRPSCSISTNDHKVPSINKMNDGSVNRKRFKDMEESPRADRHQDGYNFVGVSKSEDDVSSTAESSAAKKQSTSDRSYSVPQFCSSEGSRLVRSECSDLNPRWNVEKTSRNDDSMDTSQPEESCVRGFNVG